MIGKLFVFCAVVTMTVTAMSGAEVAGNALVNKIIETQGINR